MVVSEIIDGEAVIMHLKSGNYFSTSDSGGVIWHGIEKRLGTDDLAQLLVTKYGLADSDAGQTVEGFIATLTSHDLIRAATAGSLRASGAGVPAQAPTKFEPPVLNVFSDMKDLLLLDPYTTSMKRAGQHSRVLRKRLGTGKCYGRSQTAHRSTILVVRNGAQYIAEALASVQRSGRAPVEILLIDGHSTYLTVEIASRFPGVRIVPQEGKGIPAAYNQAIALARADTVAFISHDDIWMDGKLDLQLRAMEADPSLQFTVGMVEHFLAGSGPPPGFRQDLLTKPVAGLIMEALVARKSVFDRVGLFDTSFAVAEDTDWFARAKDAGAKMAVLPQILVRKRVHDSNSPQHRQYQPFAVEGAARLSRPQGPQIASRHGKSGHRRYG